MKQWVKAKSTPPCKKEKILMREKDKQGESERIDSFTHAETCIGQGTAGCTLGLT